MEVPAQESLISGTATTGSAASGTWTGTVWRNSTPLGVGPAPGAGTPAISSANYGFCGLERISGHFDTNGSARIGVNASGYFELVLEQGGAARSAGFLSPAATARCRFLTDFTGLPPNTQATGKLWSVTDSTPTLSASGSSNVGSPPAHIWQGFTGPLSVGSGGPVTGSRQGWADIGAFSRTSKACLQPTSGAFCATGTSANFVVSSSPLAATVTTTLTSLAYQSGYSPSRTWSYAPQANQTLRANGEFTGATTAGNFCFIAGLYTGGSANGLGGNFSVWLEEAIPPAPAAPAPQYRFRSTNTASHSPVFAWIECIPLAQ